VPRWLAAAGAFVVSLDSTVNLAFPAMARAFDAPPERVRWVIICYVLSYALLSFVGGAAGDRVGHGRVFRAGIALGAVGYVVCGTALTFSWLLGGRVVQGVGAGLVYGTTPALVTFGVEPAGRGRALGFLNGAIGLAFAVGPLLAGALVGRWGWPVVFHLRLPLALVVLAWAVARMPVARVAAASPLVGAGDVARVSVLRAGALAFLANAGIFAIWLLAPFYLLERRGLDALMGGALFTLTPLGTAVAAPVAGWIADRVGPWRPMQAGLVLEAVGLFAMSRADAATPPAVLALALFAAGFGLGAFQAPNMAVLMAEFPLGQQGAAGGLAFLCRTLGTVGGVALLGQVFAARRAAGGFDAAFAAAFAVAAGLLAVAALLATRRGRVRRRLF
jgi:DHA2 family methylenomycin A resistance protein-like MFS transporter